MCDLIYYINKDSVKSFWLQRCTFALATPISFISMLPSNYFRMRRLQTENSFNMKIYNRYKQCRRNRASFYLFILPVLPLAVHLPILQCLNFRFENRCFPIHFRLTHYFRSPHCLNRCFHCPRCLIHYFHHRCYQNRYSHYLRFPARCFQAYCSLFGFRSDRRLPSCYSDHLYFLPTGYCL